MWPPLYPLSLSTLYCKKCAKIPQQWWLAANLIQFVVLVQLLTWWWHMMCGGSGDHGVTRGPLAMRRHESTVTMSDLTQHFIILFMERFNVIIRIWIIMSNAQWIPDDLPARGCLISPMDFELGNYNVSQLLRQSRHKEQSWLSSCPDSFHRISGSRRISQLITQS